MASNTKADNSVTVITSREEDDDLEALRLAALLSRKSIKERPNGQTISLPPSGAAPSTIYNNNNNNNNKKPFPGLFHQENHRNNFGPPNKWSRQRSNLIVINPVPLEEPRTQVQKTDPLPKLILPQDKWCPPTTRNNEKALTDPSGSGKFSRIRCQSDDSEDSSDTEVEDSKSEAEDVDLKNSESDELTAEDENESSSDFLVTQEHDSLDDIDGQTDSVNEKCSDVPKTISNAISSVDDSGSTSSDSSDSSDVDENVENVSKVATKEGRTSEQVYSERTSARNTYQSSQRQPSPKKPLDLREVLKAKRDVKNSSDYDSDEEKPVRPLSSSLKSVLSVVKRSPQQNSDLNKKLSSRLVDERVDAKSSAKERTVGRSVFLTLDQPNKRTDKVNSDGMQVTVVTGPQEEKKCSVHMRLGLKNNSQSPSKSKVPVTSRLGLAATSAHQGRESDEEGLASENFSQDQGHNNRRRRKRRSRSSTRNKRSRNSGFRGSKESERDAKIRRIEKVNTVRR